MWRCCAVAVAVWLLPSRSRRSTEAPSKHAQRKGNKLARTGRESSPGPFAGNPCRRTTRPHGPWSRQKSKKIEFVRACAIETRFNTKQKQESAVNTTRNARGQKSTPHFLRACAVETRFNIKQKHESAVHTTRNARGQKSTPHFVRACAVETHFDIKQEHKSAVHTTQNARGQKSTPHFVRACAVEAHFDIKQEHESAVNTTQNARGQSGRLNLAPRPFLLP